MKPEFYRTRLKNGMIVLFEKRKLPVISVAFAVRAGAINESANEKGISHYIEHMLYKGTPSKNTKQIAEEIEKNGGILNGFTSETLTAFWCKMPSKHLSIALSVLADMIKNPLFDEKELEKERKVIFEEIKMRKDNPQIYVSDKISGYLYEDPMGIPIIGTYDTMRSITREKILKKFNQIYQPNNIILCVVGDADLKQIVKFAEENFPAKKGNVPNIAVKLKNEQKIEKREGIDQANLVFAYHAPLANNKKNYSSIVLNTLMATGMSSRLFSEIREKRNLAYAVIGDNNTTKDFAYNYIYVGTTKENVEIVKELILKEFKKVAEGLDEKELKQVKEQLIGNYQLSTESSQAQMVNLICYENDCHVEDFYKFREEISKVELEDVKELARLKNYSFFALVPK